MRPAQSFYRVHWIYTKDFPGRQVPLVFLSNGKPGFAINQWIYSLLHEGVQPSKLEEMTRAVLHLYAFTLAKYGEGTLPESAAKRLIADFIDAKVFGTVDGNGDDGLGLYWKPTRRETVKQYLIAINAFDVWQSTFHSARRLNPSEDRLTSAIERYREFRTHEKWDPFLHLLGARSGKEQVHKHRVPLNHKRFDGTSKSRAIKAFPIHRFVELVEKSPNPRDKMMWLLLGMGSLRRSEPLHLFLSDVSGDTSGIAMVRLDDPEAGVIEWEENGALVVGTRTDYFDRFYKNEQFSGTVPRLYQLKPRTKYWRKGSGNQAGFKGMTFGSTPTPIVIDGRSFDHQHIFWLDPRAGAYFLSCYDEYLADNFFGKPRNWPYHPFLFINLDNKDFGLPMTLPALRKAWGRALRRLGLSGSGLGPHSLRHMFGHYCANVLKLPVEFTQVLMHHGSVTSTQVYYSMTANTVRRTILQSALGDVAKVDALVPQITQTIKFPKHWVPDKSATIRRIYE